MSKLFSLIVLAYICVLAHGFCDYRDSKGNNYNFGTMRKDFTVSGDSFNFKFHFCDVATEATCKSKDGSICAYTSMGNTFQLVYGRYTPGKEPKITGDDTGLVFTFKNGDVPEFGAVTTIVNLNCGSEGTPSLKMNGADATITLTHPAGCPVRSGGGGGGPSPAKKKDDGLSGGAIFLIVLACVLPVYIILGCVYNIKVKKMPFGINACPQKAFWFALPGLIKDGSVFTYQKLRGLCGKKQATSEGGYDDGYGTMA